MASPMQAVAHSPAAVVSPFTSRCSVMRMVPVPKKPMPLITWAPKRVTSLGLPTASREPASRVWSMASSYWPRIMDSAAPMHTIM